MSGSDAITRLNAALEGRYMIERELGQGGMATVYLADDLKHERKVAVKVLKPELAAVVGAQRFLAEIKTTANLQHPHILPLHDSGGAGEFLFYVMPYVEGESLRERIDREKQLGVEDALAITRKVAGALDYAHSQGVVHRDIKPGNILLSAQGEPLVADFGIALAVAHAGGGRITETGLSLGTPHYMSPEQATGDQVVGRATDTYALGCVLFEMLVGEPPYTGSTAQAVLGKIIAGKVASATEQRPAVPPNVDAAIAKALEKLPADRFTSAQDFARALTDPGFRHGVHAGPVGTSAARGSWNRLSVVMTGLSAVLAAILGWQLLTPEAPEGLVRFVVQAPDGVNGYSRCCGPVQALSPDGQWLVFVGLGGGEGRDPLYRRHVGQLTAEEIPGTDGASSPFFNPDGRWLGFHSDGRLRKVPMTGGPPVPITQVARAEGASWGDDDVIVFGTPDGLFTVPGAGGEATAVPGTGEQYVHPWVLPGGGAALVTTGPAASPPDRQTLVVDLGTGAVDTIGFGTRVAYASGHIVFSGADGTLLAQPFDPTARRTTGQSVAILDGVRGGGPSLMGEFALSSQGGLVYQPGAEGGGESLVIVRANSRTEVPLPETGILEDPAFSPDGRRIAMRLIGPGQDIRIFDRDQQTFQRFTVDGGRNDSPVWAPPDGAMLAFSSNRDGGPQQLYWRPADLSGPAERLLETDYPAWPESWFPDGRTLAFMARRESEDIGVLTIGDSTPTWVAESEFREFHPQVSPDGAWLAFTSDRSGNREVYVVATSGEGGQVPVSTNGGEAPQWAPDQSALYFVSGGMLIAASFSTEGGFRVTSREERFGGITDLNVTSVNYDVSPDGEEFVIIGQGTAGGGRDLVWILNWPEIVREMTSLR